ASRPHRGRDGDGGRHRHGRAHRPAHRPAHLVLRRLPGGPCDLEAVPGHPGADPARRARDVPVEERPGFAGIILVLLLPLVLIFFNTAFSTLEAQGTVTDENVGFQLSRLIGATPVALALSALLAMLLLYVIPRRRRGQQIGGVLEELVDDALAPVCSIILITGAGGAFGAILTETGIGGEVAEGLDA